MWAAALLFTSILIVFMMTTFFWTPQFTIDQRRTVLLFFPLLAGFSTFFLGGSALVQVTGAVVSWTSIAFSATAGIAVFVLCYLYPPYFFKIPQLQEAVDATRNILQENPNRIGGDEANRRKILANGLYRNCTLWSQVLLEVFDEAGKLWVRDGANAARDTIMKQQMNINKLDYWSLENESPVLSFLRNDENFLGFANKCATFYSSALNLKQRVAGDIRQRENNEIHDIVDRWKADVEAILRPVADEFHRLTTVVG